jgi:hypothetical protein
MPKAIITQAQEKLQDIFDIERTNQVARETKFMIRDRKLDGIKFLKTLVFGYLREPQASLNQLCQVSQDMEVMITRQGLDDRLNDQAVKFLQECLKTALEKLRTKRCEVAKVLDSFTEVYLLDSTVQSLPETLKEVFRGVGGNASEAAVKIQLLFGFRSGTMEHLEFVDGRFPDTKYQGHLNHLAPGSLLIQDLGYFNLSVLLAVIARGSFFLTRWRQDASVFWDQAPQQALDMLAFLEQQISQVASYNVQVGVRARLPCRMICVCLPEPVVAKRRRRLKATAKRVGKTASKHSLVLCDWNVFLTNVPEHRLSPHQILACYSLRWQIELIFKLWKSQAAIKHLRGFCRERILCELYAKMIVLVIAHFVIAPLRFLLIKQQIEISSPKALQILRSRAKDLLLSITRPACDLQDELSEITDRILHFARKDKRKKQPNSYFRLVSADSLRLDQLFA